MAFGGGGGGFSFGSNNNTSGGFGGFGSTQNNTSAFGSSTSNATGFGNAATANPFSGSTSTFGQNTGGGFGQTSSSNSLFGAKSNPFSTTTQASSGGGLFGSTGNTNAGFGSTSGFGASTGFSSGNSGGSAFTFGQNKPAFGQQTGSSLFGSGNQGTTGSSFGATSSPFGGGGSGTALGTQPVPPSEGTASTPFAPTIEKESPTAVGSNAYQSITMMQPYQKYSFEELRLADYNAGRRYGNGTGQAGAFGSSTFGGGFGTQNSGFNSGGQGTTGGIFGQPQSSSTSFGGNTSTSGFGSGGLFSGGAGKTGGLFSSNQPSSNPFGQSSQGTTSGGLFGQTQPSNTTGSNLFGQASSGSTLFGQTQTASAPSGGLFGSGGGLFSGQQKPASTGFSFGGGNNTTASNSGGGLFGSNQQQQSGSGAFGAGFGATNQPKPSLFGSAGSAFGSTSTQGQTSSLFSTTNNDANKPSGGLFGSGFGNTGTANTGGSLFSQPTQTQGNSLFNSSNPTGSGGFSFGGQNQNQSKPSLFGGQTGGSLFNTQPANNTGSIFGGGSASQTNNSGSLFNTMNNSQQQQQQNAPRVASALDQSAYGQSSIWTGLPTATPQNSAPLVTPLKAAQKLKESKAPLTPIIRMNHSRYNTPPRRPGNFGFSYSTYGTPNSAASTPGTGSLLRNGFGNSLGRSSLLGKSFSASNLRQQYNDDHVLSPGAMTPKIANFSTGSMRRLKIDHSLRQDLFSPRLPALPPANSATASSTINTQGKDPPPPTETTDKSAAPEQPRQQPKKRVSFDRETTGGGLNGESGALVRTEEDDDNPVDELPPRSTRGRTAGKLGNGDLEQGRAKELAVVPEDRVSDNETSMRLPTDVHPKPDPEPGNYWMIPSKAELQKMPRDKLKAFAGLQVGRSGCGHVTFDAPVDLTSLSLDDICGKFVEIRVRSITVYPESSSKPPRGKGLNVPSTLYIENSWPRARNKPSAATSGPVFDKHIQRLRRMAGTEFIGYDVKTGVWTFKVPHYTRYGLDYEDDDEFGDSIMSLPSPGASIPDNTNGDTHNDSDPDDTFMGKQKTVPGGYGRSSIIPYDEEETSENSAPPSEHEDSEDDVDMAGSYPAVIIETSPEPSTPAPALKASFRPWGTPGRPLLDLEGDWAEQLQRTISPRKQNRDALREAQSKVLLDRAYQPIQPQRPVAEKQEFRTSIDVMNSLFGKHQQRVKEATGGQKLKHGQEADFEFPYTKRAKTFNSDATEMTRLDAAWHDSFKPHWTGTGRLLISQDDDQRGNFEAMKITSGKLLSDQDLTSLMSNINVTVLHNVPFITHTSMPFSVIGKFDTCNPTKEDCDLQHITAYKLAHLLFDNYVDQYSYGLSESQCKQFDNQIRRDRLTEYLATLVSLDRSTDEVIGEAPTERAEHLAVIDLCQHDIEGATRNLKGSRDHHLALLVSQLDQADDAFQSDISSQIKDWNEQNIISEMSEPIRALYGILSGNTSVIRGNGSGPMEDRSSTFAISERFNLNWLQAFGLTLWYGKNKNAGIEESIVEFASKLESGEEIASPVDDRGKEDILWVLLKLYASRKGQMARPVLPQTIVESSIVETPLDTLYAFTLHHALAAKLGTTGNVAIDADAADQLAADLAFELSSAIGDGNERDCIVGALFALLHIKDDEIRAANVKDLLNRFAAYLPDDAKGLTHELQIPAAWIWEAKAQYARSGHLADTEIHCLIKAKLFEAAHECLCRRVAPTMIIDEDWTGLAAALALFPKRVAVKDWANGGAVYGLFAQAMNNAETADFEGLQAALVEMGRRSTISRDSRENMGIEELREHVAIKEMSRVVASRLGDSATNAKMILPLPMTSDTRVRETKALAVNYYQTIMAR